MIFNKRMISSVMAAAMTAMTMLVFPAGSASAGETLTLNGGGQRKDTYDGYSYELWIDNTGGSGSMTLNAGGSFDTEWKCEVSQGNFLARRGKDFDRTKKATDIGNITLEYDATYSASSKGNSRLCVYGWMVDPLAEYYIIEDWVNWCPGPDASVFPSKTVTIDGADYEIFWIWHEGPTIEGGGNKTFKQYFSIRKSKRTSGTITVSDHFKAWEAAGMDIGNLTEVALNVEGWESSGRANVTKNVITVGGEPVPTEPTTEPTTETTQPTTQPGVSYMATIKDTLTTDIGDANTRKAGVDYGQFEEISYYSSVAQRIKKANVLLPANYDPSKKYPVMYVNHGIFGDHNSMTDSGMGVQNISRNLAASGEAKDMIIVLTSMYNDPNVEVPSFQITLDVTQKYDLIREDIIECLMPYINEHYSTLTGRENTAICGFSMGGRESLYTGVTKPEYFGYIGAACPAPGVTPGEDNFMNHPGNMSESEFRITNPDAQPYVLFIAGGTNDGVVGKFPQRYDSILTTNGQEHLWLEVPGGGHDGSVVQPMMYNFIKNVFKAT